MIFQVLIRNLSRLCVLVEIMSFNNGLAVVYLKSWGKHLLFTCFIFLFVCMCGGQGTLRELALPPRMFWELSSGHETWPQVPLLAKLSHKPAFCN